MLHPRQHEVPSKKKKKLEILKLEELCCICVANNLDRLTPGSFSFLEEYFVKLLFNKCLEMGKLNSSTIKLFLDTRLEELVIDGSISMEQKNSTQSLRSVTLDTKCDNIKRVCFTGNHHLEQIYVEGAPVERIEIDHCTHIGFAFIDAPRLRFLNLELNFLNNQNGSIQFTSIPRQYL